MLQRDLRNDLQARTLALRDRVAALARPLDPERLLRRPADGGWSVGHVLEHLCVTAELYEPPIRALVRESHPDAGASLREWKPSLLGRLMVRRFAHPKRMSSPGRMTPSVTPRGGVVERLLGHLDVLKSLVDDSAAFDWRRLRMRSPVVPLLRFNLGDAFLMLVVHAERHAGQMDRVVAELR
jgi:hypothetical protein